MSPVRTAEAHFIGDAGSLIRAAKEAAAASAEAEAKISAANTKVGASAQAASTSTRKAHEASSASAMKAAGVHEAAATKVTKAYHSMAGSIGLQLGVAGLAAAGASATKMSLDFGRAMLEIRTQAGATQGEVDKMSKAILDMKGVQESPIELSKALFQLESVGIRGATALSALKAAADGAAVGHANLTDTTSALASAMAAYHINANKAHDTMGLLNAIVGQGRMHMEDLVNAMASGILPTAHAAGISLDSLGAAIATMTASGFPAEKAATLLRTALFKLAAPAGGAAEALKTIHLSHDALANTMRGPRGLVGGIELLESHLKGLSKVQQVDILSKIFSAKSAGVIVSLGDNLDVLREKYKNVQTHTKEFGTSVAAQHHTAAGKIANAWSEVQKSMTKAGDALAPVAAKMAAAMADSIKWFEKHKDAAKALGIVLATFLGGIILDFAVVKVAKFVGGIKTMIGWLSALGIKMGVTAATVEGENAAMVGSTEAAAVSMKAALITTGIGAALIALGVAGYELGKHWKAAMQGLEEAAQSAANFVVDRINDIIHAINKVTGTLTLGLAPAIGEVGKLSGAGEGGGGGKEGFGNLEKLGWKQGEHAGQHQLDTGGGAMAFFMSKGLTAAQAAGVVGNIQQESNLNPNAPGGGLFQGIGSRASLGKGTAQQQLEHAWQELVSHPEYGLAELRKARSPQEAARIFSERFEKPERKLEMQVGRANRERYAAEAFRDHPQRHASRHGAEAVTWSLPEGGASGKVKEYLGPNGEVLHETAAQHSHRALLERKAKIEGAYVQPFQHATGVTRSRTDQGVDFSFGGSLGAIGPGVVEKIAHFEGFGQTVVYRLTSGPHKGQRIYVGLETGGKATVHEGQRLKAGQQIAQGYGSGGIEMGFAGPEGLPIVRYGPGQSHSVPTAGGEAFSKFLASIGKGGSNLQLATAQFSEVAKRAAAAIAHLILSPKQERTVTGLTAAATAAHAAAQGEAARATQAGEAWEHLKPRQEKHRRPLYTAEGVADQTLIDEEDIQTAKARKLYYEGAVRELAKEAKAWGKLRSQYRSYAKHAKGNAKKEALNKAAGYDGKVKAAQKEAQALNGTIHDTEEQLAEAEQALTGTLPGEIAAARAEHQAGDLSAYQAALSKIDLEERAGILSPAQAKYAKEKTADRALHGDYGELSPEGLLQARGDLREFRKALTDATSAQEANTQSLKDAKKALDEFNRASEKLAGLENSTVLKAMADLISGQIGGVNYHGRAITAGAGSAARY